MADRPRLSVCMATYNGEKWIDEQVAGILGQLGPDDELVVFDDASKDGTVARLRAIDDDRLRLTEQPVNAGYVATFQQALRAAQGDVVMLADQDDVWPAGRVDALLAGFGSGADLVAGNIATLGGPATLRGPFGQPDWILPTGAGRWSNVLGILAGNRPYFGCALALTREAAQQVQPFPAFLHESHDLWIALDRNLRGRVQHIPERVVLRRFHADNASTEKPRGLAATLRSRWLLLRCVAVIVGRRARRRS